MNGKMRLNKYGIIAKNELLRSTQIRNEIILDEFVIMPNHIHLIICIEPVGATGGSPERNIGSPDKIDGFPKKNIGTTENKRAMCAPEHTRAMCAPEQTRAMCAPEQTRAMCAPEHTRATRRSPLRKRKICGSKSKSIGSFMAGFKSAVTQKIKKLDNTTIPIWQRNYYEHIIRDEITLNNTRRYVKNNLGKWHIGTNHA